MWSVVQTFQIIRYHVYTKMGFDNLFENSRGTATRKNVKAVPLPAKQTKKVVEIRFYQYSTPALDGARWSVPPPSL